MRCTPYPILLLLALSHVKSIFGDDAAEDNSYTSAETTEGTIRVVLINSGNTQSSSVCTPRIDLEPMSVPLWTFLGGVDLNQIIEEQIFQGCSSPCQNGGICRDGMCVCPLNFSDPLCTTGIVPLLTKCTEGTCRNGGMCVGTSAQPICRCEKDIRGVTCERRPRSYILQFKVNNGAATTSTTQTSPPDTDLVYKAAEKWVELSTKLGDERLLVESFLEAHYEPSQNNSDKIFVRLTFDFTDSMALNYTTQCILGQVLSGADRLQRIVSVQPQNRTEVGQIKLSDLMVQAEDMCKSGNHDCSMHATCKMLNVGTYTCVCNTFTIDISLDDRYPGRRCVYDGLIILIFILVGFVLSTLIIILCGCRRTIWYRRFGKHNVDHMNLVTVAKNYDI